MKSLGYLSAGIVVIVGLVSTASAQTQVEFAATSSGQITFSTPSGNIECTLTPAGGTPVYQPEDGGPELSCDRRDPAYIRLTMTPKSVKQYKDVGDQSCCTTDNPLPYGSTWSKAGFACTSAATGLTCRRRDGRGFSISKAKVSVF